MNDSRQELLSQERPRRQHAGPPLWLMAIVYTVLFLASLLPVTWLADGPSFPSPWESSDAIAAFFQAHPTAVRICAFLQFGAAIPLGIFGASAVSRLQFLGARVAGVSIALFGGIATAVTMMAASIVLWVMGQPGISEDRAVLQALYWLVQGLGGPGFAVPFGILVAGITIPGAFMRLIPKWLVVLGMAVAICGELSWLYMMAPAALPLVSLARFPGFAWMIATGLAIPTSFVRSSPTGESSAGKRL